MTLLDMENRESILSALSDLEIDINSTTSPILEEYLREVAKHGLTFIPWFHIKPLILQKFNHIMDEFIEDVDETRYPNLLRLGEMNDLRKRVYKVLSQFEGTPFTIQRICELLTEPRKHYTRPDKFLRGLEKACLVVSTVDCYGNKIHNIDHLSGSIKRSAPTIVNGSSVECDSNDSLEDSSLCTRRSDEKDRDLDDGAVSNESVSSPRRPCINFYRSLTDRRSKLIDGQTKSTKDSILSSYSPGIPGKRTLQRPFLSGRASPSFRPILEETEDSIGVSDEAGEKGKKSEDESVMGDTNIESEKTLHEVVPDNQTGQKSRPLIGRQKPFVDNDVAGAISSTSTTVPPIDQMLRPMGQLEAFVNTISIVTTTLSPSGVSGTTTATASSDSTPKEQVESCSIKYKEEEVAEIEIPVSAVETVRTAVVVESEEGLQAPVETVGTQRENVITHTAARASVKRESLTLDGSDEMLSSEGRQSELVASPAKRLRTDYGASEEEGSGEPVFIGAESPSTELEADEGGAEEKSVKNEADNSQSTLGFLAESLPTREAVEQGDEVQADHEQTPGETIVVVGSETEEHESS